MKRLPFFYFLSPVLAIVSASALANDETDGNGSSGAPATPIFGAGLSLPGTTFSPGIALPGWSFKGSAGGMDADADGWRAFRIRTGSDASAPTLEGRARFSGASGAVRAEWRLVPSADANLLETFVGFEIAGSAIAGGTAQVDNKSIPIVLDGKQPHPYRGPVTNLSFVGPDGAQLLRVVFDRPTRVLLQDGAHWGGSHLTIRVFFAEGPLTANREYAIGATISTPTAGPLALGEGKPVRIVAGEDWLPLAGEPWIEPGSALDFSSVLPHDTPAGKHGRVVAVGDHFEFTGLPGVTQRFYGVNLCGTANLPSSREAADRFAANIARIGYNTLRFHHHERNLIRENGNWADGLDDTAPAPEQWEKFDNLVAACVENGIYLTTDLFVSRSHLTTWRSLGIDRDGCIGNTAHFKVLCAFWDPAYENLCAWTRAFLTHVNPRTGRSLADEPALATLALINEGNLGNWGGGFLRDLPGVAPAWQAWLAAKRNGKLKMENENKNEGADPAPSHSPFSILHSPFDWNSIPDTIPDDLKAAGDTPAGRHAGAFALFLAERETQLFERLAAFVRDECGCKAPLSSLSCWYNPVQYQLPRTKFDYVDDHFYVDHPSFLDRSWSLPSRCPNQNPMMGRPAGARSVEWRRLMDKPFCLTEWNYSGPGRFRGVGGIATGALGALQNWSGMWRFAWSHGRGGVEEPEKKTMGYFDMSGDPLGLAAERAALCLFLRRDLPELPAEYPLVLKEAALRDPRTGAPSCELPSILWAGWHAKVGSAVVPAGGSGDVPRPLSASLVTTPDQAQADLAALGAGVPAQGAVSIDSTTGTFLINTPRTAGGFAESGTHTAGPLRFALVASPKSEVTSPKSQDTTSDSRPATSDKGVPTPATVWVSSLDNKPIAESSHLLLTHLTDVQNSGIEYADPALTILLKWGSLPHLMRRGAAHIELSLEVRGSADANEGAQQSRAIKGALRANEERGSAANDDGTNLSLPPQAAPSFAAQRSPSLSAQPTSSLPLKERPVIDGGGVLAATVYRLSPSGRRLGTVPATFDTATGLLRFTARTDLDPATATYLYEIVR